MIFFTNGDLNPALKLIKIKFIINVYIYFYMAVQTSEIFYHYTKMFVPQGYFNYVGFYKH